MPPSSILVIRRLDDPLPGSFAGGSFPGPVDPRWQQALRSRLSDEARRACRPVLGRIDPAAPAVRFRDESELLACLALDRVAGRVGEGWWWRTLLAVRPELRSAPDAGDRMANLFLWHPRRLPAVFDQLDAWGSLGTVTAAMTESAADELLDAVVEEYGLDPGLSSTGSAPAVRGRPWVADGAEGSGSEPKTARLVHVALAVQRQPSRARTREFTREVEAWWSGETGRPATASERRRLSHASRISQIARAEADSSGEDGDARSRTTRSRTAEPADPGDLTLAGHDAARADTDPRPTEQASPTSGDAFDRTDHGRSSRAAAPGDLNRAAPPEAPPGVGPDTSNRVDPGRAAASTADLPAASETRHVRSPDAPAADRSISAVEARGTSAETDIENETVVGPDIVDGTEDGTEVGTETTNETTDEFGIETRFGGAFYLIQLAPHLEPAEDVELSWTLVEALARALLTSDGADCPADPIWSVLAEIDGRRPGEPPDPGHPAARFAGSRLRDVRARLLELLDAEQDEERDEEPDEEPDEESEAREDPVRALLAVPARLYVTRTHVDVVVALDHISLAARRAGLDRDPGWVRELGRVVLFHFE